MSLFMPSDCSIDSSTPYWLLAAFIPLAVAGIALVMQMGILWRREVRARITRWARLPLALPLLWAALCGVLAAEAWDYYRAVTTPLSCPPTAPCSFKGLCMPVAELLSETRFALLVAILMLGMGWLAISRLARHTPR